jgi:hypothetical protein
LGATEVTLGRLHRDVSKEELDLLQFAAGCATESSATPPKIVRRKPAHTDFRRELLDDVPNEFLRHHFAPDLASATHAADEASTVDSGSVHPLDQETTHPIGNGHGPNRTSLPTQIDDRPMTFTLLEVINRESSEFVSPKTAGQKDGEQRTISLALHPFSIGCLPESFSLICG